MIETIKQLIIDDCFNDAKLSDLYNDPNIKTRVCIFKYPVPYILDKDKVAISLSVFFYYPTGFYKHYSGKLVGDNEINILSKFQLSLAHSRDLLFREDWTWFDIN